MILNLPTRRLRSPERSSRRSFPANSSCRMASRPARTLRFRSGCSPRMRSSRAAETRSRNRPGSVVGYQLFERVDPAALLQVAEATADLIHQLAIGLDRSCLFPGFVFVRTDE